MASTSLEDDIIKRRLLIEGDSGNEDRLINKLIKNFVKWANTNVTNENGDQTQQTTTTTTTTTTAASSTTDEENSEYLYEQMIASLSHAEFGLSRNHFIMEMNKAEQENYEILYQKINDEIEKAKKKIVESKLELEEARKIRKNRQEYDVIARQIQNYPDRTEMQNTIKNLEDKVEHLKKIDAEYDKKIDLRRKQFSVVLQSLSSLKSLIETDSKLEDIMNIPQTEIDNDDAVAPDSSSLVHNHNQTTSLQLEGSYESKLVPGNDQVSHSQKLDNLDEMEDDNLSQSGHGSKREKHYSVAEVEMEEVN